MGNSNFFFLRNRELMCGENKQRKKVNPSQSEMRKCIGIYAVSISGFVDRYKYK